MRSDGWRGIVDEKLDLVDRWPPEGETQPLGDQATQRLRLEQSGERRSRDLSISTEPEQLSRFPARPSSRNSEFRNSEFPINRSQRIGDLPSAMFCARRKWISTNPIPGFAGACHPDTSA